MTLGSVKYTNVAGTSGQFLKYDGVGNASWGDIYPSGTTGQFLKLDGTGNATWSDIDKTQIDYATAYQQVTYQDTNSGNANYIGNNSHIVSALNDMSQALATLATAVQAINDKYVLD